MSHIVLYRIPSSEIDFLLQELERPYYWNPAHSHLMRWELRLTTTDIAITSDPLAAIADLPGDIVLDGLLDDGIDSKGHQRSLMPFVSNVTSLCTSWVTVLIVHTNFSPWGK